MLNLYTFKNLFYLHLNQTLLKMKLKSLISCSFLIFVVTFSYSQTSNNPWSLAVGVNAIGLMNESNIDSEMGFGFPYIGVSRHIKGGLSIGAQYNIGESKVNNITKDHVSIDGFLKYNLSNKKFIPFIIGGYGLSNFENDSEADGYFPSRSAGRTIFGGIGFDIFFTEKISLKLLSSYRSSSENGSFNHIQNVAALTFNFGGRDSDKDGITDKKDKCPEIPGLKEFEGCPDTDGDSVPDNKDGCPEDFGLVELNGCPDYDNDGIIDKNDSCPNESGLEEFNGCPDSDEDGVIDGEDKCPDISGDPENEGCPWPDTDGDSISDNIDSCPDQPGTIENSGCPELSSEIVITINELSTQINFAAASFRIQGKSVKEALIEIKILLDDNPDGNLVIEGHTSSDGDEEDNLKLSKNRADAVRNYLISVGVNPERLKTEGYGEERPLSDNDTMEGRLSNRRVQFRADFK